MGRRCYAHPHAIVGGLVVGASLFAGLVLAILGVTAQFLAGELASPRPEPAATGTGAEFPPMREA